LTLCDPSVCCPHALITCLSFTDRQYILSIPLLCISSANRIKPGKCWALHVGVNAPGT
jgi:hypothetical protein